MLMNDERIGVRTAEGKVAQWPTLYATGGVWNRRNNPAPTTVYFGPEDRYFYVLPVRVPFAPAALRAELESKLPASAPVASEPATKRKSSSDVPPAEGSG